MLQAALDLAARGMPVFPCDAKKRPLTHRGFKDATTDADRIRAWWTEQPNAMIGVPTGEPSGMVAIDLDVKDEVDGRDTWDQLRGNQHIDTRESLTPSGGAHLLFQWPGFQVRSTTGKMPNGKVTPGIDVRGDGGYIIVPPSRRADGQSYQWEASNSSEPAPLPTWLLALLSPPKPVVTATGDTNPTKDSRREPREKLNSALFSIKHGTTRDEWVRIGMAYRSGGGDLDTFESWCRHQPGYESSQQLKREWDSWSPDEAPHGPPVTAATLFRQATTAGWQWQDSKRRLSTPDSDRRASEHHRIGFAAITCDHAMETADFLIQDLQESDTIGVTVATDGVGKTFLNIAKAECIAHGRPFAGKPVKQGPVAIIASEGRRQLDRRHKAWRLANDAGDSVAPIYRSMGTASLLEDGETEKWIESMLLLDELPIYLSIDTLNRNMGPGDENSTKDMTVLLQRIEMIRAALPGLTVELQHHPGWTNTSRERGASSFFRGLDWRCQLELLEEESEHGIVVMRVTKMKDAELPAAVYFERRKVVISEQHGLTSLAMIHVPEFTGADEREIDRAVLIHVADHPSQSQKLRAESLRRTIKDVEKAVSRLKNRGLIEAERGRRGAAITVAGQQWLQRSGDPFNGTEG
ncbi:MAG: bifunctional DNA primase/polymerase [Gammaproteobacteria bacterium]|nr:bifunctional DNA primase/polymerase [Gammaproteobacteria bacterium]